MLPKLEAVLREGGADRDRVRAIVQTEFREAMQQEVVPELERLLKSMLGKVREPLTAVNKALYEKLVQEEARADLLVQNVAEKARNI